MITWVITTHLMLCEEASESCLDFYTYVQAVLISAKLKSAYVYIITKAGYTRMIGPCFHHHVLASLASVHEMAASPPECV